MAAEIFVKERVSLCIALMIWTWQNSLPIIEE
jgi:hypothetical protein